MAVTAIAAVFKISFSFLVLLPVLMLHLSSWEAKCITAITILAKS
jgi:hypothetical protein